ncbi:Remorin [Macleaya cordata]|uniref:Remorin n=1 Tax=Macleaya cordata TaxID=56857 RepID=A0A200PRB9_MACCD|nr:Remorin [Macleaya cordata]
MESLVKQMRVRFSGLGEDSQEGPNNARERRLPPQKTQSFKGERKNWFQRQFSGQMNEDKDSSDIEFATMIAAAAFAINSLEEAGPQEQKKMGEGLENPLTSKSRKEESSIVQTDPGRVSRRFSGKEIKEDKPTPGEASKEISEIPDGRAHNGADQKTPIEGAGTAPIIKKTPTFADPKEAAGTAPIMKKASTFADPNLNGTTTYKKLGTAEDTRPTGGKPLSTTSNGQRKTNSAVSGGAETKARAWEEAEKARIKKWYEKMNSTILSWENEKKVKAKRRIERIESQLEKRRARALQNYRIELSKIDKVAGGTRSLAEERKRNEESKIQEKAKKIRSTGKVPATCFCF